MYCFPFISKVYKSDSDIESIISEMKTKCISKDWHLDKDKILDNYVREGEFTSNSFSIVNGRYGLTYGRTSLLPILNGNLKREHDKTIIRIAVRPSFSGLLILCFFYLLLLIGISVALFYHQKVHFESYIVGIIFIAVTYGSVITKFNKEVKSYLSFMDGVAK